MEEPQSLITVYAAAPATWYKNRYSGTPPLTHVAEAVRETSVPACAGETGEGVRVGELGHTSPSW